MSTYTSPLEETIKYEFKDRELLGQAITHCSFVNDRKVFEKSDNEKLEYLGDAILNTVISILLYKKYGDKNEGFLSNARSCLVRRDMLTEIARTIKLDEYMSYGNGKIHLPRESKVLSNMLEALIGALYLDGGFRKVSRVIKELFSPYFDEDRLREKNPKNILQEYSQKKWGILPKYRLTRKTKEGFSTYVYVGKELKAKGVGKSKREAEQMAASLLLQQIEVS
ncbi:MAG: Ribonuclease 3 [Syntrophorhabdaceae bacterium PtaU1.Bin034]|jgi:ribonuclease-3|nr:MAG: Ribonuclease 3 [Syntrophorhabdaceae bacterium PtaU1.Bin034]